MDQAVDSPSHKQPLMSWSWKEATVFGLLAILALAIGWHYVQLIDTEVVGFIQDDGVYTITGKALASGEGFKLIHVVSTPTQVKYPILYPLILSVGWLLSPTFPQNLPLLNEITIGFTIAAFVALFYYFRFAKKASGWFAALLMLLVAANFQVMLYTTMLMSEGPYLLFSTLLLLYAETQLQHPTWKRILSCILLSALAFHTRALGLLIMVAIGTSLLFRKQGKAAMAYMAGTTAITIIPWLLWAFLNQPHATDPITKTYGKYGVDFWVHAQGTYGEKLIASVSNFIYGLLETFSPWVAHFLEAPENKALLSGHPLLYLAISLLITLCAYGLTGYFLLRIIRAVRTFLRAPQSFSVDISGCYLLLYCLVVLFWNFENQISRFIVVILPWLWYYLLVPLAKDLEEKRWRAWPQGVSLATIVMLALIATPRLYLTTYFGRAGHYWINLQKSPQYVNLWSDYKATFTYIQEHLPPQAVIGAGLYNAAFYLYTGRMTYPINLIALDKTKGIEASTQILRHNLELQHVRYIAIEPEVGKTAEISSPINLMAQALVEFYPTEFQEIYTAPGGMVSLYEFTPATHTKSGAENRP